MARPAEAVLFDLVADVHGILDLDEPCEGLVLAARSPGTSASSTHAKVNASVCFGPPSVTCSTRWPQRLAV